MVKPKWRDEEKWKLKTVQVWCPLLSLSQFPKHSLRVVFRLQATLFWAKGTVGEKETFRSEFQFFTAF